MVGKNKQTRDHSVSTYAKLSKKPTFRTTWYGYLFSENFAYVLNEWFPTTKPLQWGRKRNKLKSINSIILAPIHLFCSIKSKNYFTFLWKTKRASRKLKQYSMLPICHSRNPENPGRVIRLLYYRILDVKKSFNHKLQRNHYGDHGVRSIYGYRKKH